MYHPWRAFRTFTHIHLRWAVLPEGLYGYTDYEAGEVVMATGLTQAERRCTIAHETQHLVRGPVPVYLSGREEKAIDRNVARLLLPSIELVADALAWAPCIAEAADELWVDEDTLRARLEHLHPAERGYLRTRLAEQT